MTPIDPLQSIKDTEDKVSEQIAGAQKEIDYKLKDLETASENLVSDMENSLAAELGKIESAAVSNITKHKEDISQKTKKEISDLQNKAEGRKAEAVNKVIDSIIE